MSKKTIILLIIVVALAAVVVFAFSNSNQGPKAVQVKTEVVKKSEIVETVSSTGIIQPQTQVKISADVAAKIIYLPVKEGDWVEKGQLLLKLDSERYVAAVERAQANLRSNQANANLVKENMLKAEKDYNRTKELHNKQLESQATLDQQTSSYMVEKARYQSNLEMVAQAQASLKQAQDDLSKTTIYAPMSGTISKLNKEVGEIALGSQFQEDVILVLANLNAMEALVDVDENDIVALRVGDKAKVEVDALPGKFFDGSVSEIASSAKQSASGTADQKTEFEVKILLDQPGSDLRPGMTSSADVVTETRNAAVVVPLQSVAVRTMDQLKSESDSTTTYTADADGFVQVVFVVTESKVKAIQVETGIQSDSHIEVLSGITEGDEVVTGNYRAISQTLNNNTAVEVEKKEEEGKKLASK